MYNYIFERCMSIEIIEYSLTFIIYITMLTSLVSKIPISIITPPGVPSILPSPKAVPTVTPQYPSRPHTLIDSRPFRTHRENLSYYPQERYITTPYL